MNNKIYNWRELNLQSLDLILCAGNSKMSRAIQKFQRLTGADKEFSRFSHVAGIDVWRETGGVHVQESTTLNEWAGKKGVQRNPMEEWLLNYNGKVFVRQLDFTRTDSFVIDDEDFWNAHYNDPYENGIAGAFELFLCGMRLHRCVRWINPSYTPKFTDHPHCTELEAKRLIYHGLMTKDEPINRLPPWMWANEIDENLRCDIGELIRIK